MSRLTAAEYGHMPRRLSAETGAVQRIMIAMNQEHCYAVFPQLLKRLLKAQLSLQ
ncbi:hypothetical protein D3C86_1807630 [compost metagenome]